MSEKIARELLAILKALHGPEQASKYKSFVQAIQTAWSSRKIAETQDRSDSIQKAPQFHLQITMSENIRQSLGNLDDASHARIGSLESAALSLRRWINPWS